MTPHDFAAQGRILAAATPGPWWTDGLAMGLRHLRRNWEPYGEDCPDGFDLPTERDAIWLTALRNTIDDLRAVVKWAWEVHNDCCPSLESSCSPDVYAGFVAALARFSNVGEVRS